ncbi:hypothetical protein ACIA74_06450 [Streptomyces sp. NPDC051658]|uniref:hypothetical protein n=1 Tax=Streptomyces sp. NPDC051658 TaxID=3365667 RepID=UPI0037AFB1FE
MTAPPPAQGAYRTPECRTAVALDWAEAHHLCPGERAITATGSTTEQLRCACPCHR